MSTLNFEPYKANLSLGTPGWQNTGSPVSTSGGTGMPTPLVAAAGIDLGSKVIGGLLGAGGKKKDRKHQMDMLIKQIAAAEKAQTGSQDWQQEMRQEQWGEQERRQDIARGNIAPEQGFIPTYQSLRETNPMLQKFFGGQMSKLFGENYGGMGDMFGKIEAPGYTGFEQEQAPLEKHAASVAAAQEQMPQQAPEFVPRKMPGYFREKFGRGRRGSRMGGRR